MNRADRRKTMVKAMVDVARSAPAFACIYIDRDTGDLSYMGDTLKCSLSRAPGAYLVDASQRLINLCVRVKEAKKKFIAEHEEAAKVAEAKEKRSRELSNEA